MAASFDALLRIKADVQGEGAVQALATRLGGLQRAAGQASVGFKGLLGSASGLIGGLQSLVPLATGAGLAAMATSAINAADNLRDMSQKTGVSVERLSQLRQAAEMGGTTIESVSGALTKFNRGIVDGKAGEKLEELGISATDANGKLRSTDEVLLDVADKFAKMPDGANKTAAAIALFGRAGADMIPMLNGGSQAIRDLSVTMTTDFANSADEFNDKMVTLQTSAAQLGVKLGTALMPLLIQMTDGIIAAVQAFSQMPEPLQATTLAVAALVLAWGPLVGILANTIMLGKVLIGLKIGATIAGWAGAVVPAIAAMSAAFSGFLAFLTGTILPGLLAFFSGPLGWTVLAIAAVVAMAIAFRKPIMEFLGWFGNQLKSAGSGLASLFNQHVVAPISDAWRGLTQILPQAMQAVASRVVGIWNAIIGGIRSAFSGVVNFVLGLARGAAARINGLIQGYNNIPVAPDIPLIPAFAKGGYVTRPTPAMIGDGGEPEYVVPQSKLGQFFASVSAGRKGNSAISGSGGFSYRRANITRRMSEYSGPGYLSNQQGLNAQLESMGRWVRGQTTPSGGPIAGTTSPVSISVQTGPVMEFDGQRYVTVEDFEKGMRATADGVFARMRTPAARQAIGMNVRAR